MIAPATRGDSAVLTVVIDGHLVGPRVGVEDEVKEGRLQSSSKQGDACARLTRCKCIDTKEARGASLRNKNTLTSRYELTARRVGRRVTKGLELSLPSERMRRVRADPE